MQYVGGRLQVEAQELLGTRRSLRPLDVEDEEGRMEPLLRRLQRYYAWRGIDARQLLSEYDFHSLGVIHESQFYRALPKPLSVVEEDVALLVQKYRDPERPGLVNYMNLSNDLDALGELMDAEKRTQFEVVRDMSDYLPRRMRDDEPLQDIMDRIRVCSLTDSLRLHRLTLYYNVHLLTTCAIIVCMNFLLPYFVL